MNKLALWGYDRADCRAMFNLSEEDMASKILEYGCGPNILNLQQKKAIQEISNFSHKTDEETNSFEDHVVISCDPLFVLDKDTLSSKVRLIFADVIESIKKNQIPFDFNSSEGLDALVAERLQGIHQFFEDYDLGKMQNRYLGVTDYHLPFSDFYFDFALSAHYLFADLQGQTVDYHLEVIRELARVAKEVRLFPLIDSNGDTSQLLGPVLLGLQQENYGVEVKEVNFHLHKAGNAMLRIWAQQCPI